MAGPGFLLVDKEQEWTSHDVVARLRRHLDGKVGHAGTLDPMATGLLVIGFGNGGTRLLRFVQGAEKEYVATAQLGVATDSLDADGSIISRDPMPVDEDQVREVMQRFVGVIHQVPPMVSARKVEGQRLYEMARRGEVVEREARPVTIHELELTDFAPSDYPEVTFRVVCSTGTYVRTLGDDIARALGGRAHLTALRRVRNGSLDVGRAVSVESVVESATAGTLDEIVVDPNEALASLALFTVDDATAFKVRNGVRLASEIASEVDDGALVRVVDANQRLLAVYRRDQQQLVPEVVVQQ